MPGLGSRTASAGGSAVTPDREVEVHFDVDESVLIAPPFSYRRFGKQIIHDRSKSPADNEMELLKSEYWIIRPLQGRLDHLHETTEMGSATMLLAEFNAIAAVKQEPLYRTPTEIPGITVTGTTATSANDLFFTLRRPAGVPWTDEVDITRPKPALDSAHLPYDRVMNATTMHPPNQGYLLRWQVADTQRHAPDNLLNFYFGGPLFPYGWGEYCLAFHGSGTCVLYEYAIGAWDRVHEWHYCQLANVMSSAHTMRILPHISRFIEFKSETNEAAMHTNFWGTRRIGPYYSPVIDPSAELYIVNPSVTLQPGFAPNGHVTGSGYVRVDVRRDQRIAWQISLLQYPERGVLYDYPFSVPCFADSNALIKIKRNGYWIISGDDGSVLAQPTLQPVDASTDIGLSGNEVDGYSLPIDPAKVAVVATLSTTNTFATPFFRGYSAELIGALTTKTIGEVTGGAVMDYQITGPSSDPSQETAFLRIEDTKNELTSVRTRAGQNCRIQTSYDPNDPSQRSILFHGRVSRSDGKLMGWDRGQEYPDPEWYSLSIALIGEWQKLYEQLMVGQFDFSYDETADEIDIINGSPPAWKISRVVEHLVSYCGYPTNQIDVATIEALGTRIPLEPDSGGAWLPSPFTRVGDYLQRILRDYLGAYLIWDANAINGGLRGMWRVILGPTIADGATPLYSFTTHEPMPASGITLLGRTESYPADTTFIVKGSFNAYPVPPEANAVLITATGDLTPDRAQMGLTQCAINYRSYDPPGGPGLADPLGIDYIGHFIPVIITDPLIAPGNTAEERQAALDLATRRIFNFVCRARRIVTWEAPLALIEDPTDSFLDRRRPLRYGDFVRVDGVDCILKSCNPSFTKDHMMMAYYEAEVYRAPD